MDQVFALIFNGLADVVEVSKMLSFTAFGFTVNWWDFSLALMVVSIVIPLFFTVRGPSSGVFRSLVRSSERNDKKG